MIEFWLLPEKYLGGWVLISVDAKVISYFRSLGRNVRCMIEFMMISGNILESSVITINSIICWAKARIVFLVDTIFFFEIVLLSTHIILRKEKKKLNINFQSKIRNCHSYPQCQCTVKSSPTTMIIKAEWKVLKRR